MNRKELYTVIFIVFLSLSHAVTKKNYYNYSRPVVSDYLWGILSGQASDTESVKKYFDKAYSTAGSDHIKLNLAIELLRADEAEEGYKILNGLFDAGFRLGRSGIYLYLYESKKGNTKRAETVLDSVISQMYRDNEPVTAAAVINQKINDNIFAFSSINEFKNVMDDVLKKKYGRTYDLYFSVLNMQFYSRTEGNVEKISSLILSLENEQPELPYLIYRYAYDEYIFNKSFDKAAEILAKMSRITYGEPEFYSDTAELYSSEGDFKKARNTLLDGIKLYPESSLTLQLAELYIKFDDVKKAYSIYNSLAKKYPEGTYLHQIMATVFSRYGKETESLAAYEKGLEKDPDSPELLNNYSYQLAQNSLKLDKALENIDKALAGRPESVTFLDTKAWILFKSGNVSEAEKIIDIIFKNENVYFDPSAEELFEHLTAIKKALNKSDEIKNLSVNKTAMILSEIILRSGLILQADF